MCVYLKVGNIIKVLQLKAYRQKDCFKYTVAEQIVDMIHFR